MMLRPDSPVATKVFASPNHGERRAPQPSMLVLHYTGMPDAGGALTWLANPVSQVSCHYFVFEDGRALQMVPESRRAWHAGVGAWEGITDINSHSIGIEIANPGHEHGYRAFADAQMAAVTDLCADIVRRWRIAPSRVLAHSDIAPLRKEDPGELFDWQRLSDAGVGLWVPAAPIQGGRFFALGDEGPPIKALQAMFGLFGYGIENTGRFDDLTQAVVRAFQRHYRQKRVDGVADQSTIDTLRDLIARKNDIG